MNCLIHLSSHPSLLIFSHFFVSSLIFLSSLCHALTCKSGFACAYAQQSNTHTHTHAHLHTCKQTHSNVQRIALTHAGTHTNTHIGTQAFPLTLSYQGAFALFRDSAPANMVNKSVLGCVRRCRAGHSSHAATQALFINQNRCKVSASFTV